VFKGKFHLWLSLLLLLLCYFGCGEDEGTLPLEAQFPKGSLVQKAVIRIDGEEQGRPSVTSGGLFYPIVLEEGAHDLASQFLGDKEQVLYDWELRTIEVSEDYNPTINITSKKPVNHQIIPPDYDIKQDDEKPFTVIVDASKAQSSHFSIEGLQVLIDWGDGSGTKEYPANQPVVSERYDSGGEKQITLQIKDPIATSAPETRLVPLEEVPILKVEPIHLDFKETETMLPLKIINDGGRILQWDISENIVWLDVEKESGSTSDSDTIRVTVDRSGLKPGDYKDSIKVTTKNNTPKEVQVNVTIAAFTVTPARGDTVIIFTVDASSSSDAFDDVAQLKVRWDWENNEDFNEWTTQKTDTHQYTTWGDKTIKLEVRNSCGGIGTTIRSVHVDPQKPQAQNPEISPPSPGTADDLTARYTYWDAQELPEEGSEIQWFRIKPPY